MLTSEGLQKSYGSLKVLKGVTLDVQKGEIVAIGPDAWFKLICVAFLTYHLAVKF